MRLVYVGNVGDESAPHSTENEVRKGLEALGHEVVPIHEQRFDWDDSAVPDDIAFVLWTHTHGFAPPKTHSYQTEFLRCLRARGIPSVSFHLDRYWDMYRETQIYGPGKEPFFSTDLMCSADGGNDARWVGAGIDHVWFPPAVSEFECVPGVYRPELASDVAFVGSWDGAYHAESPHRYELIEWLRDTYGDRCVFWPKRGQHAVRLDALRDLYASVKVLVGDSCFSGTPKSVRYVSDRIPETLGRGGLLIHPRTEGVTDGTLYTEGEHLLCWEAGDWDELANTIDAALSDDELRREVSEKGRQHVLEHHTYTTRARQLIDLLTDRGLVTES